MVDNYKIWEIDKITAFFSSISLKLCLLDKKGFSQDPMPLQILDANTFSCTQSRKIKI